jgi:chloramphenicol 3-O-phosphotransferase
MGSIVVLSGPIGAGKTTVARALLAAAEPPTAYIEGDVFWSFLVKPPRQARQRNFQGLMRAMFRAAAAIAQDGYEVILDFSMPPAFVARASARLSDVDVRYVELRASLEICAQRASTRTEGVIADYGPYADFYAMFDAEDRHVIRNDTTDPEAVAAAIREGLKAGRFRLA